MQPPRRRGVYPPTAGQASWTPVPPTYHLPWSLPQPSFLRCGLAQQAGIPFLSPASPPRCFRRRKIWKHGGGSVP